MKKPLLALVMLVLVAGCGGGGKKSDVTIAQSNDECALKQITTGARREGTCIVRGVTITVVNKAHVLHGKQYDARIIATSTGKKLRGVKATGTFDVIKLAITNTLNAPHAFDQHSDLAFLLIDGKYFGESREAEIKSLDPFRLRRGALQPDETATGTLVFDVPAKDQADLTAEGSNLILVNYEDENKDFPTGSQTPGALGYIRLWK